MKHLHILGIGGVFMGSLALIARQLGYKVTGIDSNLYPPMSDILKNNNISYFENYENFDKTQQELLSSADYVVIGNVIRRENPAVDYLLNNDIEFYSGAQWLYKHVLRNQWIIAVTGTHGKTTTTSLLAWILDYAGLEPGFLIGGAHGNFNISGRLGAGNFFVIEADEYDTSLFDKRPKFLHYFPDTLIINNIEFDHADIYDNVTEIKKQFKYLLRTVGSSYGKVIFNADDNNVIDILKDNNNLDKIGFTLNNKTQNLSLDKLNNIYSAECIDARKFILKSLNSFNVSSELLGEHNIANITAALTAAEHAGVPMRVAIESLKYYKGVSRRLEFKDKIKNIKIYDDFAHHPTAISKTLEAIKKDTSKSKIIAIVDFCSYSMREGIHKDYLADSLKLADVALLYQGEYVNWSLKENILDKKVNSNQYIEIFNSLDKLVSKIQDIEDIDTTVVFMSNGKFTKIIPDIIQSLKTKYVK
tara:strand:- start:9258 stop:10679 length:1422 start_codon:yes stop_codon:yes gene_type:complete